MTVHPSTFRHEKRLIMPIYEYRCEACGHEFEKLQKLSDPVIKDCPVCHETAVKKLISAAGFRLKGGGWYETDFKKSGQKNLAGDTAGGKSDTASGSGGGGEKASKSSDTSKSSTPSTSSNSDKVA